MHEHTLRILPGATPQGVKINITIEAADASGLRGLLVDLLQGRVNVPAPAVEAQPVNLQIAFPVPVKARHAVTVNGHEREVPAAVARVVGEVAKGARELRLRPEAIDKLRLHLPEFLAGLQRDHERKVSRNAAVYAVASFVTVQAM